MTTVSKAGQALFPERGIEPDALDQLAEFYDPTPSEYATNIPKWLKDKLGETTWSKQRDICESVIKNRHTAVHSCHDSGKSYISSRIGAWWLDTHPAGDAFLVSTAPSQTQVEAILWREIEKAHRKGDLIGRITSGQVPMWKIGKEIIGYGRKPQDLVSPEDAMAAFQGIHARYVLVILDEAGGIPKWLYDAVDTIATNEKARVLAIGNPDDPASHFEKICKAGSGWNVIHIGAFGTPAFTDEEVPEELLDLLVAPTWVEERKRRWGEKSPLYVSKVLGEFPDVSDDTLISPKVLRECQANDLPGMDAGQYGGDVARFGEDTTCVYRNRGGVIRPVYDTAKQDTRKTSSDFARILREKQGSISMVVDEVGVGAGVVDNLIGEGLPAIGFNGSAGALDKKRFGNARSETYWRFRERCEKGFIDLPTDQEDPDLIAQLGSIKWRTDLRGKIWIESKEDMKKRGLPSPDRADAAVMSTITSPVVYVPKRNADRRQPTTPAVDELLPTDLYDRDM